MYIEMLEKGNNQVEIMYLSTSSGKIRFRYDGREGNWYDFKGDARFKSGLFLRKGLETEEIANNNKRIKLLATCFIVFVEFTICNNHRNSNYVPLQYSVISLRARILCQI